MVPAPLVSSWAFAGAVSAADGTGGAAVRASARAVAATACCCGGAATGGTTGVSTATASGAPTAAARDSAGVRGVIPAAAAPRQKKTSSLDSMLDARQLASRMQTRLTHYVEGRACQTALALLHAGLHLLRHSRTCVLGPLESAANACTFCFVLEGHLLITLPGEIVLRW